MKYKYKQKSVITTTVTIATLFIIMSTTNPLLANSDDKNTLNQIQKSITEKNADWIADTTSVSSLSDYEMKMLLGASLREHDDQPDDDPYSQDLPDSYDWRNISGIDFTTPVKNQRNCGSCVAFGVISAFEVYLKYNSDNAYDFDLSEGHLFFCGGGSCGSGWWPDAALSRLKNAGVPDEACLPYDSQNTYCDNACDNWEKKVAKISIYRRATSINGMKEAIVNNGPLVATFIVYEDFRYYNGGIYEHVWGSELGGHCVSIVGYNDDLGYWICKNSWGPGWGENGFFKIKYKDSEINQGSYYMQLGSNDRPNTPNNFYINKYGADAGEEITFTTSTTDPNNNGIYYLFDWDDGTDSGWMPVHPSGEIKNINHSWSVSSNKDFDVKVKAMDVYGLESDWSSSINIKISNKPPSPPIVEKTTVNGEEGYKAKSSDPDDNQIYYKFNWGDGSISDWYGPYESGEFFEIEHEYEDFVMVRAKDEHGAESSWSEISKSKNLNFFNINPLFVKIFNILKYFLIK